MVVPRWWFIARAHLLRTSNSGQGHVGEAFFQHRAMQVCPMLDVGNKALCPTFTGVTVTALAQYTSFIKKRRKRRRSHC